MRPDPYRGFRFRIIIDGFLEAGGFTRVSGLGQHTEVIPYAEGGGGIRKLMGRTDFPPIVLERGLSVDLEFQVWASLVHNIVAEVAPEGLLKQSITIQLVGKTHTAAKPDIKKQWLVFRCWPSDYEVGDFDSMSSSVVMERLILQNEGNIITSVL